jgi:hypothetical protein
MRFLFFISLVWTITFFLHWLSYTSLSIAFGFELPYWGFILSFLSGSYLLASGLVRKIHTKATDVIYFIAASWLGTIFIIFSFQLVYTLVEVFTGYTSSTAVGVLFVVSLILSVYALYNGHRMTQREYTLPIAGLQKTVRAVHLTDIHIGTVHQTAFLTHVVQITNKYKPDVVYITGDLFDGSVPVTKQMLTPLNALTAPVFFSNGNHEEYEGLQYVRDTVGDININQLENSMVMNNGIQVVGINDRLSLKKDESVGTVLDSLHLDMHLPTVLLYHTPVEWHEARERGVDVMLSGHTHNGQIYPFTLLVRMFFKYIKGLYEEEEKFLHVSPGTGTWGPPMRLGSRNQITLLNLVPKE